MNVGILALASTWRPPAAVMLLGASRVSAPEIAPRLLGAREVFRKAGTLPLSASQVRRWLAFGTGSLHESACNAFFDALTTGYRGLVGDFAKKRKLPTIFGAREFAEAGGLMSYAADVAEGFRRAATYVD